MSFKYSCYSCRCSAHTSIGLWQPGLANPLYWVRCNCVIVLKDQMHPVLATNCQACVGVGSLLICHCVVMDCDSASANSLPSYEVKFPRTHLYWSFYCRTVKSCKPEARVSAVMSSVATPWQTTVVSYTNNLHYYIRASSPLLFSPLECLF